jgi:hypothetical protein
MTITYPPPGELCLFDLPPHLQSARRNSERLPKRSSAKHVAASIKAMFVPLTTGGARAQLARAAEDTRGLRQSSFGVRGVHDGLVFRSLSVV